MLIEGHWKRRGSVEGGGASLLDNFRCFECGEKAATEGDCGHHVSLILEHFRTSQ